MAKTPTAIDLFSGAGGLSEGLRQAGFRVVAAVEVDSLAASTYKLNHPTVELIAQDITKVSVADVRRKTGLQRGQLDLLAACPPCQGFSTLRTRNGSKRNRDSQNDLIFAVLKFVRGLRPKTIMIENVPGLGKSVRLRRFRMQLTTLGYKSKFNVLNVSDFCVPQRRRRLVLVASRIGDPEFAKPAIVHRTVRDAIGGLPRPSRSKDPLHNYRAEHSEAVFERIKLIPKDGGSRSALGKDAQLGCHKRVIGFKDVYGRMAWGKFAPTITGGCINPSKGRFLHPSQNRAISLREAALLQSFPKSYAFDMSSGRYPVALMIGNALPPEFIRRQACSLLRHLRLHSESSSK